MKKLLALLLVLTMLFSVATVFAGCEDSSKKKNSSSNSDDEDKEDEEEDEEKDGEDEKDEPSESGDDEGSGEETDEPNLSDDEDDKKPVKTEPEETEPEETEPEETEPEETEPEETEPEEDEPSDEAEILDYVLGVSSGSSYQNDFIGFSCELPEDWYLYDREEILIQNGIQGSLSDQEIVETLDDAAVFYTFYAISDAGAGSNTLNINLEKVDPSVLDSVDMEDNLNTIAPTLQDTMLSMGFEYYEYEVGTDLIGGKNVAYLAAEGVISDMTMYQFMIMVKCDGYVSCITLTTVDVDLMMNILNGYSFS